MGLSGIEDSELRARCRVNMAVGGPWLGWSLGASEAQGTLSHPTWASVLAACPCRSKA